MAWQISSFSGTFVQTVRHVHCEICSCVSLRPKLVRSTSDAGASCLSCCWLSQELYSHYTQQVKDTCASLSDPHKAYLLRKAMHYFNTQRQHRVEAQDKPLIEVRRILCHS